MQLFARYCAPAFCDIVAKSYVIVQHRHDCMYSDIVADIYSDMVADITKNAMAKYRHTKRHRCFQRRFRSTEVRVHGGLSSCQLPSDVVADSDDQVHLKVVHRIASHHPATSSLILPVELDALARFEATFF